jgi:4-aminobutyrate aminotransferase-like enzyme
VTIAPRLLASMHAGERLQTRVRSGLGAELTLEDGRVVIDAGSMSSCLLGHRHPEVVAAVEKAARTVYVGDCTGYTPREQAVEDLLRIAFGGEPWADTVALFVSSSEAADLGLLLAQMLTGREPLVSRALSYHGGVGLGREISNHPLWGAHLAGLDGGVTPRPTPKGACALPLNIRTPSRPWHVRPARFGSRTRPSPLSVGWATASPSSAARAGRTWSRSARA